MNARGFDGVQDMTGGGCLDSASVNFTYQLGTPSGQKMHHMINIDDEHELSAWTMLSLYNASQMICLIPPTTMNPVTSPPSIAILPTSPSRTTLVFTATPGNEITDDLLNSCANLFNANYGIWGSGAATISKYTKPGQ